MATGILSNLNEAQCEAVTTAADVVQVLAPPGSGKTKTLTARVAYLLAERRLKPWNIIVCTFTVKAANEMKERITKFVGHECAKQLKLGTFHSVALRYLKQYGQHIGLGKDFGIADSSDSKAIVKRIIKKNDFSGDAGGARGRISTQKAKGIDSEQFWKKAKDVEQQEFARIYQEYEETLKASDLLDYDDLLLRCCLLLRVEPACVSNVEALLIDEYQDTNNIQYDLMGLFAQHRNVITIVGDPDQSIYGFRSAEIKNLTRMKEQWPDTLTINLEENYRSSGAILHAAQHIIEQDESRPPKKLQATHTYGQRPVLRKLPSAAAEADWLVAEIQRIQALSGDLLQPNDFAVLLRSAALSRAIETALGREGVPYRMIGGMRFYDRAEVKLLVDYLRVVDAPGNNEAVERIINVPPRRVGEGTVKGLHEEAQSKGVSLWSLVLDVVQGRCKPTTKVTPSTQTGLAKFVDVILSAQKKLASVTAESAPLVNLLQHLITKLSYQDHLKRKFPDEYEARWTNVEELVAQTIEASDPERLTAIVNDGALPSIEGLERRTESVAEDALSLFLANVTLATAGTEKAEQDGETAQQLTISTIHGAKGLEWPVVFIPACYDGSIPHSRADDNDEERRLLYVGMTRAQALLYLSTPLRNSQREEASMSTFLTQPGVAAFFEEHGPGIAIADVRALAKTLRRDCPSDTAIAESKKTLERDEDNYWPLTGEEPFEERAKWDRSRPGDGTWSFSNTRPAAVFSNATVTMQQKQGYSTTSATTKPGFVSAKEQYDDILEQQKLKKVDERAAQVRTASEDKPKTRKRQIEGQGTIASFFAKPPGRVGYGPVAFGGDNLPDATLEDAMPSAKRTKQPLHELRNVNSAPLERALVRPLQPAYKLPSAPLLRPSPSSTNMLATGTGSAYVFLSSSPPQPEEAPDPETAGAMPRSDDVGDEKTAVVRARPATTFHTTSMQIAAPQRKTLGMRRSLQGWNARGGKR
ncbi:ATP-dependent DNA helicase srs2 [Friedmanniomyces endolithicus]|uniref:DNA 3'-5' helicase n=1 Tax=Friedmanniomyces endolithicus TaxID=329885 RepID=A0AAN6QZ50_9PEZI|nr:ATP-dependent DNA helicase srs2 [Friedmanniomyces endolithicus]KAK0827054.1 ATP-dependent DNA helicase srs2 [Friedmanniomyces endolithicus]KAK0927368.1 ATP-dependent DNA helicase srs2 [Friedmanniomyces endolithicus]KAK0986408.1 ATP-dependent DNA helicase srs2 [Friedmanniomyces endolithicus]KAK1005899.1 ATP-dependent DNA helicase srs2 [Friedmanniomyces endolithicus]